MPQDTSSTAVSQVVSKTLDDTSSANPNLEVEPKVTVAESGDNGMDEINKK